MDGKVCRAINGKRQEETGKTMIRGDVVRARIESVSFGGEGIARVEGRVVFVPFAVTGDDLSLEIREVRKKFARGIIRELLTPSPYRRDPLCRYFGRCGGCQLQHVAYEHQLTIKERQVYDLFSRLGHFASPPVRTIIPSPREFHYRDKADYHVKRGDKRQAAAMGFMHASSDRVIDLERCEIVDESINDAARLLREALLHERQGEVRERRTLWASTGEDHDPAGAADQSLVARRVFERCLLVPREGFFQANASLLGTLVEEVVDLCALTGTEEVIDGYCGVGLFSLFLAPRASEVSGIEINPRSVECAMHTVREAGLRNVSFFTGDVGDTMERKFIQEGKGAQVVVLDPPRTGLSKETIRALIVMAPERIVYVSCNPATQARDVRRLVDQGFFLKLLQPLDMFPQTAHIEVIGLLEK